MKFFFNTDTTRHIQQAQWALIFLFLCCAACSVYRVHRLCVCVVACFTAIEFFGEMVNIQNCNVPPVSFSLQVIISLKKKSPVKKIVNVVIIIYLYDGIQNTGVELPQILFQIGAIFLCHTSCRTLIDFVIIWREKKKNK